MQASWKGRARGVVVKDGAMVERNVAWQPGGQKGTPQHQLIRFQRWIGGVQTRVTLDFQATDHIDDRDQRNPANARHLHRPLGIQFPLIVRSTIGHRRGFGQVTLALVAACELGMLEQRGNARAARQRLIAPARVKAQFRQNRVWSPARMRVAQGEDRCTHLGRHGAKWPGTGPPVARGQAHASVVLTDAAPFADGPHRTTKGAGNGGVRLPHCGALHDRHPVLKRCCSRVVCHMSLTLLHAQL